MRVTEAGFAAMARILKETAEEVCDGKVVFTFEGGYNVEGQADGVAKVLDVLTNASTAGQRLSRQEIPEPEIIGQVRRVQNQFWLL